MTTSETSAKTRTATASGTEVFIPLNKLKKSPRNARKTPHSEVIIEAYAASIAAKGIFQNLVVEPELDGEGAETGFYFVSIGEGRRLAQLLRVKRKQIKKTELIRCVIDTVNDAHEISLDENITREEKVRRDGSIVQERLFSDADRSALRRRQDHPRQYSPTTAHMTRNGNALQLLTYTFAAIDHGSLRQAARALRVQESSVSRNVVKLEQLLEMQLFERNVRGVRLTETGRAWIEIVRAHYEGLLDAFVERGDKDPTILRIGLCWVTGGELLKRLIDRFKRLYPDVRLTIEDLPAGQCLPAIRRRRFDIVFTHDFGAPRSCSSEVFWQERLFVLLPAAHSLVKKPVLTWSDLSDMCLLVPVGLAGPPLDLCVLECMAAHGGPAVQTCRANQATIIFKVQLGQGVTLAEESYARTVSNDDVQWRPLSGEDSVSSIRGVWLGSNPKRAVLRLVGLARNMASANQSPL